MGRGTGVLSTYWSYYFIRGMTVGVAGTASLFISRKTGISQGVLVAARGTGLVLGPLLTSQAIKDIVASGEAQLGVALALFIKAGCALLIPRTMSPALMCLAFFSLGVAMATLDTLAIVLVTKFIKGKPGVLLSFFDACYGIGGMVAPFISVALPSSTWDILALIDMVIASYLACRRVIHGQPRQWEAKLRSAEGCIVPPAANGAPLQDGEGLPTPSPGKVRVPPRVIRAGNAFVYMSQIASTAISAWGFTFGSTVLGMSDSHAALIPATFYFASTATRFVVWWLSRQVLPSALLQASMLFILGGSLLLKVTSQRMLSASALGAGTDHWLIFALALLGVGCSPHYSLMVVSMTRHGEVSAREHSWYTIATNMGITSGMVIPSVVALPTIEIACAIALVLILNSRSSDFPLRQSTLKL